MRSSAVILVIAALACHGSTEPSARHPAIVIAHRGASGLAPEHTFAAYDLAIQQGADYIELDVQRSSDGTLVVIHDATLDRTARGSAGSCTGAVREKTLAQLQSCDVGLWFNQTNPALAKPEFIGLRIPTLDEILTRYPTARYYIETKDPEFYPGIEADIVAMLKKHNVAPGTEWPQRVFIQSFSSASLVTIHALDSFLPLVQLFGAITPAGVGASLDQVRAYASAIGPIASDVTPTVVSLAHERCLLVHAYVVDDASQMLSLLGMGVDGIFTNRPDVLRDIISKSSITVVGDNGC
ncbi:MAG TPA: glycerophosphodiester phosphodiesterase [Gemmatimonadaceae bacterium]|nr:glycerophosphodiester phosphodiesterase [Gemmatimonadaceae bacterium]